MGPKRGTQERTRFTLHKDHRGVQKLKAREKRKTENKTKRQKPGLRSPLCSHRLPFCLRIVRVCGSVSV